jgi:hypothetical protein
LLQTHAAVLEVLLADGRVLEEIPLAIGHLTVEVLPALIDSLQDSRGGEKLEGTAQGEPLVLAVLEAPSGAGVEDGYAEAAVVALFEFRESTRVRG